jgi:hypothetical protein
MLRHKLSCHKVGLLLGVLVLEDAGRNYYSVPGVDTVVSDEPLYLADEGIKPSWTSCPTFWGSVTPS